MDICAIVCACVRACVRALHSLVLFYYIELICALGYLTHTLTFQCMHRFPPQAVQTNKQYQCTPHHQLNSVSGYQHRFSFNVVCFIAVVSIESRVFGAMLFL